MQLQNLQRVTVLLHEVQELLDEVQELVDEVQELLDEVLQAHEASVLLHQEVEQDDLVLLQQQLMQGHWLNHLDLWQLEDSRGV